MGAKGEALISGGMNENPYCFPSQLKDIFIMIFFPPLWVFLKELNSENPFDNFSRIFINIILTCSFYFPGLVHAMSILRSEGSI